MNCRKYRSRTSDYIDCALGDADREAYVAHLSVCQGCRSHLGETRAAIELLRGAVEAVPPADLFEGTLTALGRAAEPSLTILDRPTGRRLPRFQGDILSVLRRFLVNHEFDLIAYSVGIVTSCLLALGTLNGMRPVMALALAQQSPTIWISVQESEAMGLNPSASQLETVAYTIPKVARESGLTTFAANTRVDSADFMVLADVSADGRASIVEVLSGPSDPVFVAKLESALGRPTFIPARARSGRAVASRVVLLVQQVDVIG